MELCLIGLFVLVRDADGWGRPVGTPCKGQAIVMIVVMVLTVLYQLLLNNAFSPLLRYLPITLEDEASMRDEHFLRVQQTRGRLAEGVISTKGRDHRQSKDLTDVEGQDRDTHIGDIWFSGLKRSDRRYDAREARQIGSASVSALSTACKEAGDLGSAR